MKRRIILKNCVLLFQRATGGNELTVYKELLAPYRKDMPASVSEGLRRVCTDRKFAFYGLNPLNTEIVRSLPCQVVPLPDTFYREASAFIISKNSSYRGLINWR
jgi:hypothetical protein